VAPPVALLAILVSASPVSHLPAPPGRDRDCGGNTCSVRLDPRLTKTEPVRGPDSGPFTYTVTVINLASTRSTITVTCTALAPQLPCTTPSPSQLTLASGGSGTVTLGYTTLGTGTFRQLIVAENIDQDVNNKDTLVTAVPVAGPSIGTVISPIEGGEIGTGDTVRVNFSHRGHEACGAGALALRPGGAGHAAGGAARRRRRGRGEEQLRVRRGGPPEDDRHHGRPQSLVPVHGDLQPRRRAGLGDGDGPLPRPRVLPEHLQPVHLFGGRGAAALERAQHDGPV